MNTQISATNPEKTKSFNYMNLMDLYDVFPPKEIPLILSRTRQYLIDGHKWYKKNVKNISIDDIEENLEYVEELKMTVEQMMLISGHYICFGSKERGFEVNLVPFNKYLKTKDVCDRLFETSALQNKLRLFLHENNITVYKECAEFLEVFSYIITDIEGKDPFKYL